MRKFEIISEKEYEKVLKEKCDYDDMKLPVRSTMHSAGYDFISPFDFELKPGETIKVPSGIKVCMNEDEFLALLVRSSMGFKYNVRMCTQVGVIDHDYYNNETNEGHIYIALQNEGDKDYIVKKGDAYAQGIFIKYLTVDNEEEIIEERRSGLGSTSRKKD